jgi:cysteine synthase B
MFSDMDFHDIESVVLDRPLTRSRGNGSRAGTKIYQQVGNTPLLRISAFDNELSDQVQIFGKAEWFNPGCSVKDRPALNIILEAEESGDLDGEKILLDASSGNTARAYAMYGAARGHKVTLCVPENANKDLLKTLRAYGAELILTPAGESSDGAIRKARELHSKHPGKFFYADQYNNPANWQAHYRTTGVEIWRQTGGRVTHFVAGLGTSGTFTGTSRRLKRFNRDIQVYSVQPDSPLHGLEGLKHMPSAIVPGIYDQTLAAENLEISTEAAQDMVKKLSRKEGLFIGLSAGANIVGALKIAQELDKGTIVTIFPDDGRRYINEAFWEE